MRRLLLALAGAMLLAGCGGPAHDWPDPKPALWEVTGPDGQQGWLFGTMHTLPADVAWRTPTFDKALGSAGVLMVEIADLDDTARSAGVFARLSRSEGLPVLSDRVAPKDRADLASFLDRADVGDDDFSDMETWGAALVISNRARPSGDRQSPDRELIAAAPHVVGLETYEQQFGAFDTLPQTEQADLLIALAHDATGEDQRIEEWLRGDLPALERGSAAILGDPELRLALQVYRNKRWAPEIATRIAGGEKPFVAVGTAHLFGEDSVPALLEQAGYTVRRVQ